MQEHTTKERQSTQTDKPEGQVAGQTVDVLVTPKIKDNSGHVYCEIDNGPGTGANRVKGGLIKLRGAPAGTEFTVNFDLQAGDVPNLAWSTNGGACEGFWSNANACPPGKGQDGQVTTGPTVNGSTLSVGITPNGSSPVIHYALNVVDPSNQQLQFDPIIVVG
ncbi:MAG TPA: hypothetical protein VF757_11590 [Sphingomicrobium sp.]